jgi:hypothetical protein
MSVAYHSSAAVSHVVDGAPVRVASHHFFNEQRRKRLAEGSLFFGIYLLATQKKDNRLSGETDDFTSSEPNTI